eukprot:12993846-Alexandrium_andersonii.AAC.1
MRVTQGHSIPWIKLRRLGRPIENPEQRCTLGGYIYHLARSENLESIWNVGLQPPQEFDDWSIQSRPSRKFMHFLPYHPDDPRLATKARLDRSDYDALLHVDFRQCQFLNCADFVATQN